jgi:hypothetical protein
MNLTALSAGLLASWPRVPLEPEGREDTPPQEHIEPSLE